MLRTAAVSITVIALVCLILPLLAANAAPGDFQRPTVPPPSPRPSVLPPPRPSATPTATDEPLPTSTAVPEPPVVPEASSLLLLGSAASGLAVYVSLQLRARRRH